MEISPKYITKQEKNVQKTMRVMIMPIVKKRNKEYLHVNPDFPLYLHGHRKLLTIINFQGGALGESGLKRKDLLLISISMHCLDFYHA